MMGKIIFFNIDTYFFSTDISNDIGVYTRDTAHQFVPPMDFNNLFLCVGVIFVKPGFCSVFNTCIKYFFVHRINCCYDIVIRSLIRYYIRI